MSGPGVSVACAACACARWRASDGKSRAGALIAVHAHPSLLSLSTPVPVSLPPSMSLPSLVSPPAYALYRASGLGRAFVESVGEMFHEREMTNDQVIEALLHFDRAFNDAMENKTPQNKVNMEGHLSTYRYCDGVWTLHLTNATITGAEGSLHSDAIKVVACEARSKGKRTAKK